MGSETILAVIACCAIIAAILMVGLTYRMHEILTKHCNRLADLCDQQNGLLKKLNHEWYEAYVKMVTTKAEAAENERD